MKIDLHQLRPAELEDRALFAKVLAENPTPSCECAFANLILWRDVYGEKFLEVDGRLAVIETATGLLHFPLGKFLSPEELGELRDALVAAGLSDGRIYDVPDAYLAAFPDAEKRFQVEFDEGAFDYLYDLDRLIEMGGPLLRKKRNLVRQFETLYPDWRIEEITGDNLEVALNLAFELNRRLAHADFLDEENVSMAALRRFFVPLGMGGVLLYANGSPAGFSIYSGVDGETADIHFEKADHTVKGAPQILIRELARRLKQGNFVRMNREQDMGEENLRHAKRSLDPAFLYRRAMLS